MGSVILLLFVLLLFLTPPPHISLFCYCFAAGGDVFNTSGNFFRVNTHNGRHRVLDVHTPQDKIL